jgi:hypothetical protein
VLYGAAHTTFSAKKNVAKDSENVAKGIKGVANAFCDILANGEWQVFFSVHMR